MNRAALIVSLISFFVFTNTSFSQIPTDGLVAYYPFNGNANDESGNGNNGSVVGAVLTEDFNGVSNSAYFFSAGSKISVPHSSSINFNALTDSYTHSLWYNVEWENWPEGYGSVLLAKDGTPGYPFKTYSRVENDSLFIISAVYDHSNAIGSTIKHGFPIDDLWHNFIFMIDNAEDSISLYFDGELIAKEKNHVLTAGGNTWDLTIGNGWAGNREHYGAIDEVRIYNRTLTPSEIQELASEFQYNTCDFYDTTYVTVYDTVTTEIFDTTYVTIQDTLTTEVFDTTYVTIQDTLTTEVFDTTYVTVQDTVTTEIFDTTYVSVTDTLVIDVLLSGMHPQGNMASIQVYPNPTKEHLFIKIDDYMEMDGYYLRIFNNVGTTVFETEVSDPLYELNLSSWTGKGIYFLHIVDAQDSSKAIRKIILQ